MHDPGETQPSFVRLMDGVLDAARALERAETVLEERIAKDRVRSAINLYDAQIARYAAALSGSSGGPDE